MIFFGVRFALDAIEHIISAEMNQPGVLLVANLCDNTRRLCIDEKCPVWLRFAKVDLRETRCVDQNVKTSVAQFFAHGTEIREIELRVIQASDVEFVAIFAQERCAKSSAGAKNCNFHACFIRTAMRRLLRHRESQAESDQYLSARSSNGCHHDGFSMYHWIVSSRPSLKLRRGFQFSSPCANDESIAYRRS